MEQEVTLMEMLEAREARARRQRELLDSLSCPVVSFTMNIPGPVKNGPVIRRAFQEGLLRLDAALDAPGLGVVSREEIDLPTGCEALWAVRGPGRQIKELCAAIEDRDPLGRLFDLDVLDPERGGWSREDLGLSPRRCLVCGREGKGCASRRLHSVEELQEKTREILTGFFARQDREALAGQAARALMYEVCTTPKPGLVDRHNNGSHRDMDLFTFLDSTAALLPYWHQAVSIGQETAGLLPEETFARLREAGLAAERAMFRATGGVNTHKGAVFSLGCVLGAAGRLWTPEGPCRDAARLLAECALMSASAAEEAFSALTPETARTFGARLYLETGLRGIRGEVAGGFPSVLETGLPTLRALLREGVSLERAGISVLLALMARTSDTNLIARGGPEGQRWAAAQAAELLAQSPLPALEAVEALDREMIRKEPLPRRMRRPAGCHLLPPRCHRRLTAPRQAASRPGLRPASDTTGGPVQSPPAESRARGGPPRKSPHRPTGPAESQTTAASRPTGSPCPPGRRRGSGAAHRFSCGSRRGPGGRPGPTPSRNSPGNSPAAHRRSDPCAPHMAEAPGETQGNPGPPPPEGTPAPMRSAPRPGRRRRKRPGPVPKAVRSCRW